MITYYEISAYESAQDNAPLADRWITRNKRTAINAAAVLFKSYPRVEILKQYADRGDGDLIKFNFIAEYTR